jgi:hypothetical protein
MIENIARLGLSSSSITIIPSLFPPLYQENPPADISLAIGHKEIEQKIILVSSIFPI